MSSSYRTEMLLLLAALCLHSLVIFTNVAASISDSPWIVSIYYGGLRGQRMGAGSIVSSRLVVTSCRTVQKLIHRPENVWIQAGIDDLTNGTGEVWYQTQAIRLHPNFHQSDGNTWDWRHDIALVYTIKKIKFGPTVNLIKLSAAPSTPWLEAEVQGIGVAYPGYFNGHYLLTSKSLVIRPPEICRDASHRIYSFPVNLESSQLCLIDSDKNPDNCPQNVGGPVTVCGLLVGVVSWMTGNCSSYDSAILFTDIALHANWIYETTPVVLYGEL